MINFELLYINLKYCKAILFLNNFNDKVNNYI